MQKHENAWIKNGDWKARYAKLYSSRRISTPPEVESRRISFISNESTPYSTLLMRMRQGRRDSLLSGASDVPSTTRLLTNPSHSHSSEYNYSYMDGSSKRDLGGHETRLLDMVRARSRELYDELQDKTLDLPRDDVSEDQSSEACVHGLSIRMTERSISRSRVSRISTRRDMDIPSILAYTTNITAPVQLEIPAFRKIIPKQEVIPRWSIRRSVCPVCSQKWRDRTSITNVKYSGLKRNSSYEFPSVIAPARLRAAITTAYVPHPLPAMLEEKAGVGYGALRNSSTTWQLTRARRFRTPKLQMPPPEATAPPSATAPLARKDLDTRVNRFLTNEIHIAKNSKNIF